MGQLLFQILLLSTSGFSAIQTPTLPSLKGAALISLTQRETFELASGSFTDCTFKSIMGMEFYTCAAQGFTATVTLPNGTKESYAFNEAVIYKKHLNNPPREITEFVLRGPYEKEMAGIPLQSENKLDIWYEAMTPEKFVGTLSLSAYGQSAAIEARPK